MSGFTHETSAGGSPDWYTPPGIFAALGLRFALDPCAPTGGLSWIPADRFISLPDDGLSADWSGCVWLNPPYGAETAAWIGKLSEHGNGLALVFARTDTRWWQSAVRRASAVCFIAGRVRFVAARSFEGKEAPGPAAPSALVAFGEDCAAALDRADLGLVMRSTGEPRQMGLAA